MSTVYIQNDFCYYCLNSRADRGVRICVSLYRQRPGTLRGDSLAFSPGAGCPRYAAPRVYTRKPPDAAPIFTRRVGGGDAGGGGGGGRVFEPRPDASPHCCHLGSCSVVVLPVNALQTAISSWFIYFFRVSTPLRFPCSSPSRFVHVPFYFAEFHSFRTYII